MRIQLIIGGLLLVGSVRLPAQEASQRMLEQIAALKAYIGAAEKGTQLVESGLHTIRDIRNDEFHLHADYFASLSAVKPAIKNSSVVKEMVQRLVGIVDAFGSAMGRWGASPWLSAGEVEVCRGNYATLEKVGVEDLRRLQAVVTDSSYQLTDGERVRAIGGIHGEVEGLAKWVDKFIRQTDWLIGLRQRADQNLKVVRRAIL